MSFKHTNLVYLHLVELDSTRLSGRSLQEQKYVSVITNRKMLHWVTKKREEQMKKKHEKEIRKSGKYVKKLILKIPGFTELELSKLFSFSIDT